MNYQNSDRIYIVKRFIRKPWIIFTVTIIALVAVRVPFYFTHHIQEDAYITLRCAENLAKTGVYGFNPGERISASTSHLYVSISALVHLIVGKDAFIPAVQVVNTLFFIAGAYFFARVLSKPGKNYYALWVLLSLLPVSLLISYSGMETSLLLFMTGLTLYLVKERKPWLAGICIALFPWVRPDAVAYGLIIIFWECVRNRKINFLLLGAFLVGVATLLAFNQFYFGSILNQSIIAKAQTRHTLTVDGFLSTLKVLFLDQSGGIFSPIRTKYFGDLGFVFLGMIILAAIIFLLLHRKDKALLFTGLSLASMALLIPIAYALGGVIFQWYFWPVSFLGYSLAWVLLTEWVASGNRTARAGSVLVILAVAAGILAQWIFSYSWGMKEYAYRGGIGRHLAEISQKGDTLFLEPAGYIPFYSGLYTYDEAGLASPLVVHYRTLYKTPWWIRFVEQVKPDWIVQRGQFSNFTTYQGYQLISDDQRWFLENYHLVEIDSYQPADYTSNPLLLKLLKMGSSDEYYIYEINR